jgi:hypothetical protein
MNGPAVAPGMRSDRKRGRAIGEVSPPIHNRQVRGRDAYIKPTVQHGD